LPLTRPNSRLGNVAPDINSLVDLKKNPRIPDFRPGDQVRVHAKVIEGDRQRIQAFEGVVIRIRRRGPGSTFTVRRVSHGIGVERTFPYYSPLLDKVDVTRVGQVRRAKLYYLRERVGKAARIRAGSRARFEEMTAAMQGAGAVAAEPEEAEEELEAEAVEEMAEAEESAEEEPVGGEEEAEGEEAGEEPAVAEEEAKA